MGPAFDSRLTQPTMHILTDGHHRPLGSVVERVTSNDKVVSSILAVGNGFLAQVATVQLVYFCFIFGCSMLLGYSSRTWLKILGLHDT